MATWADRAACTDASDKEIFFPPASAQVPPAAVMVYCGQCPVWNACLQWAIKNDEIGVWGGTTEYQRRQLTRVYRRRVCPVCGDEAIVEKGNGEVCISCGASWLM